MIKIQTAIHIRDSYAHMVYDNIERNEVFGDPADQVLSYADKMIEFYRKNGFKKTFGDEVIWYPPHEIVRIEIKQFK